jgi:hypothetical protein
MINPVTFAGMPTFGAAAVKVQPSSPVPYVNGYLAADILPAQHLNWFLANLVGDDNLGGAALNHVIAELDNVLTASGIAVAPGDDTQLSKLVFPIGTIIMFDANNPGGGGAPPGISGAWVDNVTIPNWYACVAANAGHGCPNLVDKFIMGKVVAGAAGTGGSNSHTIASAELPTHTHTLSAHTHALSSHTHDTVMGSHSHTQSRATAGAGGALTAGTSSTTPVADASSTASVDLGTKTSGGPSNNTSGGPSVADTGNGGFANTAIDTHPAYYSLIFIRRCA